MSEIHLYCGASFSLLFRANVRIPSFDVFHAEAQLRQDSRAWPHAAYRGTSLTRKRIPLGLYNSPIPGAVWLSQEVGRFLLREVPLYCVDQTSRSRASREGVPLASLLPKPEPQTRTPGVPRGGGREFFIDNLLVRVYLIIEMISVDRPCAMGV